MHGVPKNRSLPFTHSHLSVLNKFKRIRTCLRCPHLLLLTQTPCLSICFSLGPPIAPFDYSVDMHLKVDSAISNGVYNVLEVIIFSVFVSSLQQILRWYNLKTIYDDRRALHLYTTRFAFFSDPGLSSPFFVRVSAILIFIVLSLTTAGSFSILGEELTVYTPIQVPAKVKPSDPGHLLDFRPHISSDFSHISAALSLLRARTCHSVDSGAGVYYSYFSTSIEDLNSLTESSSSSVTNGTCLMEDSGYRPEPTLETTISRKDYPAVDQCEINIPLNDFKAPGYHQINITQETDLGQHCPMRFVEVWCSNLRSLYCAGSARYSDGKYDVLLIHSERSASSEPITFLGSFTKKPVEAQGLRTIALLFDTGIETIGVPSAYYIALHKVEKGVVYKSDGVKNITKVNMRFLSGTLGLTIFVTFLGVVVALLGRETYVRRKGRLKYNGFCSAADARNLMWGEAVEKIGALPIEGSFGLEVEDGVTYATWEKNGRKILKVSGRIKGEDERKEGM